MRTRLIMVGMSAQQANAICRRTVSIQVLPEKTGRLL